MRTFKKMRGVVDENLPDILANHAHTLNIHALVLNRQGRLLALMLAYVVVSATAIVGHLLGGW